MVFYCFGLLKMKKPHVNGAWFISKCIIPEEEIILVKVYPGLIASMGLMDF